MAGVTNGVPPYYDVHVDARGEVGGVLRERVSWWWYGCGDGLLECM